MDERTRREWEHMDAVWSFPDDAPDPEGTEIDLDRIGREDMEDERSCI